MKKLIALTLALLLCLCTLVPASAQSSVRLSTFKTTYNNVVKTLLPNFTVTWSDASDGTSSTAMLNGVIPGCVVLVENGYVTTVGVIYEGTLDEDNISVFLSLCSIAGTTLKKMNSSADINTLFKTTSTETYDFLLGDLNGTLTSHKLWGYDAVQEFEVLSNGDCQFLFMVTIDK